MSTIEMLNKLSQDAKNEIDDDDSAPENDESFLTDSDSPLQKSKNTKNSSIFLIDDSSPVPIPSTVSVSVK